MTVPGVRVVTVVASSVVTEPVGTHSLGPQNSQCERAVAMPWTRTLSLSLLCAVCASCVAVVPPPPSFRSANLTTASLLAADKYGKTVLSGDGIAVAAQEYADSVVFLVRARTRGYVAVGFAETAEALSSVDVLLLWVDDETGTGHILVSFRLCRIPTIFFF